MINELAHFLARSENAYFADNEQTSITVLLLFYFTHAKHHLIKLKLYDN